MKFKQYIAISLVFLLIAFAYAYMNSNNKSNEAVQPEEVLEESAFLYGIRVDTLNVVQDIIQKNQFVSDIFQKYNVNYDVIHKLTTENSDIFNFKNLRAGNPYYIIHGNDSSHSAKYFIYEKSKVEYIVCSFKDSVCMFVGEKDIVTETKVSSGVIQSSLYNTMSDNNLPIALALKLADIYAWTIDFYHIQPGDKFKVVYEEQFVEGESLGITEVKGAVFNYKGKDIYAFKYKSPLDEEENYFGIDGESLKKAFLKMPLEFGKLTSAYNPKRFHPVLKKNKPHLGTDYAAPHGTPILATGNGVVIEKSFTSGNGNYVKIKHNKTYTTQYLHMSKFAKGVNVGTNVAQGQVIGYVGSTGLATGPHVCYRFWKNGVQVDPRKEESPTSDPIPSSHMADFKAHNETIIKQLESVSYHEFKHNIPFVKKE